MHVLTNSVRAHKQRHWAEASRLRGHPGNVPALCSTSGTRGCMWASHVNCAVEGAPRTRTRVARSFPRHRSRSRCGRTRDGAPPTTPYSAGVNSLTAISAPPRRCPVRLHHRTVRRLCPFTVQPGARDPIPCPPTTHLDDDPSLWLEAACASPEYVLGPRPRACREGAVQCYHAVERVCRSTSG